MMKRSQQRSQGTFGAPLVDQQLAPNGVPEFVDIMCQHILSDGVVQYNGLFAEQASNAEIEEAKELVMECTIQDVDLTELSAPACTGLLAEYFKDLPEPLTAHLCDKFLQALDHPSEQLQLAEAKALVRQLPEPKRTTLVYMLKFLNDVVHYDAFNQSSTRLLGQAFAQSFLAAKGGGYAQLKQAGDRVKLLKVMIEGHADIAEACGGGGGEGRALPRSARRGQPRRAPERVPLTAHEPQSAPAQRVVWGERARLSGRVPRDGAAAPPGV